MVSKWIDNQGAGQQRNPTNRVLVETQREEGGIDSEDSRGV
jgi:hypothetical protein